MDEERFQHVDNLFENINKLLEAFALLEKVYQEIGPYQDGKLTQETWFKVRDYFGFDDSP